MRLGTGGPLALLPEAPTSPMIVMNGDLLTGINISRLLAFHRAGGFAATMALREHTVKVPFGVAEIEGVRVAKLIEKPALKYRINAGIYVLEPKLMKRACPRQAGRMYPPITELLERGLPFKERQPVGAYHMQGRAERHRPARGVHAVAEGLKGRGPGRLMPPAAPAPGRCAGPWSAARASAAAPRGSAPRCAAPRWRRWSPGRGWRW